MKFTCEKSHLLNAISIASRAAAAKSPVQMLEGLLIEAIDDEIKVTGYDLKTGIVTTLPADITENGGIVLNARLLGDIIRRMPAQDINISVNPNHTAIINSDSSQFEILGSPSSDYPELPSVEVQNSITIDEHTLKKMISQTNFAVSDNESRPIHMGALFEVENSMLTIVAVDGFRLALRREAIKTQKSDSYSYVVPGTALSEVERILSENENKVSITLGAKHIQFSIGDTILISRRLEGEFLNYRNSIPQLGKYKLLVEKNELIDAVQRVALIINEKLRTPIRCIFKENGNLELYTASPLGRASDKCTFEGEVDELEIGFNDKYLLEALRAAPSDEVLINLNSGVTPCVIHPADESDNFLYMILPVRLKAYED